MMVFKDVMRACKAVFVAFALCVLFVAAPAQADDFPIPHLTGTASDWGDWLYVDNMEDEADSFTLQLFDNGTAVYSGTINVGSLASDVYNLKSFAPNAQCGLVTTDEDSDLEFRLVFDNKNGGGLAEFALSDERDTEIAFLFTDYENAIDWKGAGIANLTGVDASVTLYAVGDGVVLGATMVSVPALSNISAVHSSWFPGIPLTSMKKLFAVSNTPITGLVISGAAEMDRLLFTLAESESYFGD